MLSLSLLLLAAPADDAAAKVAAAPLDCVAMDAAECRLVEDLLLAEFSSDERFAAVISGQDLSNLLSLEQQKMAMGCDQTSCLSELGAALNVGHLLTAKLGTVGGQITLSYALLDTREATVVVRRQTLIKDKASVPSALKALVADGLDEFFTKTGGSKATKEKVETTQGQVEGVAVFDLEAVHGVKPSMARVLSDILLSNLTDSAASPASSRARTSSRCSTSSSKRMRWAATTTAAWPRSAAPWAYHLWRCRPWASWAVSSCST